MIHSDFSPTDKQAEIIRLVFKAADAGYALPWQDLKAQLSYGPKVTPAAISCSLKFLKLRGMIDIVYGPKHGEFIPGMKAYIKPTVAAYRRFRPYPMVPVPHL